ncbi:hypothetical protein P692DRAFT_20823739 [Suillus brevipes Sb2]|nr:hypothetical protein P692DRAFT_20823739 [Suillus brevipes Sb2]
MTTSQDPSDLSHGHYGSALAHHGLGDRGHQGQPLHPSSGGFIMVYRWWLHGIDQFLSFSTTNRSITNGANEGIHMQTKTHKPMVGYHPQRLALLGPDLAAGRNFNLKLKVIWPALSSFRADVFTAYYHLHRVTVVQTRWLPHHESSLVAAGLALAFPRESSLRDWGLHSRNFSQIPCPQALVAFSCSVGTRITPLARDSF